MEDILATIQLSGNRSRFTKMNDNGVFETLLVREVFCVHEKKKRGNSSMVSSGLHIQVKTKWGIVIPAC